MNRAPGNRKKVALVIGSGGIKCIAALGIWKVLQEAQIPVDMVIGCSGGSVVGANIALGYPTEKLVQSAAQLWTSDITRKIDVASLWGILNLKRRNFNPQIGIFDDTVMSRNITRAIGERTTFADTLLPFFCMATDFHTGEAVVLSHGPLARAVRISSGIPVIFKPIEWEGQLLIDGGLSNPLPIDVAILQGADIIIAVGFETPVQPSVATPANYAMQMFNILVNQLLARSFAFYNLAHHSEIVMIIPEFLEGIRVNEVSKIPFIIQQGENEARKQIAYIKELLVNSSTS
ncbi:MAG TPA: patatin-like phospholipase family protein [Anaerolineales bacterium]